MGNGAETKMKTQKEIETLLFQLEKELQKENLNPQNLRNAVILSSKVQILEWVLN